MKKKIRKNKTIKKLQNWKNIWIKIKLKKIIKKKLKKI